MNAEGSGEPGLSGSEASWENDNLCLFCNTLSTIFQDIFRQRIVEYCGCYCWSWLSNLNIY